MRWLILLGSLAAVGCGSRNPPPVQAEPVEAPLATDITDSSWTWVYIFDGRDTKAVVERLKDKPHTIWEYHVDRVTQIRDTPGVKVEVGATLVRVEVNVVWLSSSPTPLFRGVVRHQDYITQEDRKVLAGSRSPLPASSDTVAVLIPVRKSAAWWALPADERSSHFRKRTNHPGHTAIGVDYINRVYRKLYHTRYAVETADHDFLTYFEFEKADEPAFDRLLATLREQQLNPEWGYVDREYELWMTRTK